MRTLREEIIACSEGQVRILEVDGSPIAKPRDGEPDQSCELTFRFGDDFTGFRGHFPGHPILPAFVQLLMAECAVCLHHARPWSLRRAERGKFLKPIGPNEPVTVCWQEQPQDDGLRCNFTLRAGAQRAAVFALELTAPA